MRSNLLFIALPFTLFTGQAQAQLPIVDIGMVPLENGQLELRLRPDAFFDGLFSSLTIAVRHDEASVATLAGFTTADPWNDFINLSYSESVVDQGYVYDLYVGFGVAPFYSGFNPTSWTADQEVVLGHFAVNNGPGTFQLVQVCPPNSQGNYYVSLNSEDRTGIVYEISTSMADRISDVTAITIVPNPSTGPTRLSIDPDHHGPLTVEVLDAAGRTVQQRLIAVGSSSFEIDASTLEAGSYLVRVSGPSTSSTVPWIVQEP